MPGSYDQFCPVARSLDVLGDRWTLLVLRELSMGRKRFTDLRNNLVGIPPNVLSQRLKRLSEDGLVALEELPPPAARSVYALTHRGREVIPVLRALVRFGMPDLPKASAEMELQPGHIAHAMFVAWFDEVEARRLGVDEHYDLVIDGTTCHLSSGQPRLLRRVDGPAAVTVEGPAWAFARLRQDESLDHLAGDRTLTVTGSRAARSRFRDLFALV